MERYRRQWTLALTVVILATLAFIWRNSFDSVPQSQKKSLDAVEVVRPVLEPIVGQGNVTDLLVRKLAHFSEFFLLGGELALWFWLRLRGRIRFQSVANALFVGLLAALADETIQIFSARGSQVQDVLLDFAGYCTGHGLLLAVWALTRRRRRESK